MTYLYNKIYENLLDDTCWKNKGSLLIGQNSQKVLFYFYVFFYKTFSQLNWLLFLQTLSNGIDLW